METNCPGGPVERLVGRLRVAATKLGRSDEWEDLRDDLHHAAAEIERLRALKQPAIPTRDEIIKLWDLAMLETATGLDAMEYFTRAILVPNSKLQR